MPTFLSDPTDANYLLLAVAAVAAVWYWFRSRQMLRDHLVVAAVLLAAVGWGVTDLLVESPREQAVAAVLAMGDAANARRWDDAFAHIADPFQYHGTTRAEFRALVSANAQRHEATVQFKQFDRENVSERPPAGVRIGFVAQVTVPAVEVIPYYVEADFAPGPDGRQRMTGFAVYNVARRVPGGEERVPGLP